MKVCMRDSQLSCPGQTRTRVTRGLRRVRKGKFFKAKAEKFILKIQVFATWTVFNFFY